ncbi:AAA family ATPase [uncultured Phascolarctobacterium sp.]|uniref:AAA family ATPase n=1 Tax=uncultured Phascolarctobacterium sp. TaxID=512296 RepID=UPI00262ED938|nr:AAA family ATPase [uncultured Phascolarctobacterium sp.]
MEKKSAMQNMAAKPAIRLPLPIGVADYRLASTEYYYIDKTLMIKEFLDERPMVSLFTRPRRFGKTLNMDMLRTFFEKTAEDTSVYFRDKAIWQCGERYRSYQGKYPVIFLTFKDVKFTTWQETFQSIRELIAKEAYRHIELKDSDRCDAFDKKAFLRLQQGNADETELANALADLSLALHKHYGIAPIIIIDEYDIPIQQGYMQGFYDKVILFMRNLFSGGLKDNKHLSYGFLTGILRVAKESIFSGLNNLVINSVLDNKYSEYFGFTASEVQQMAAYYGVADKYAELCAWYDGYRFGRTEIFNPWSVINYFNNGCEPRAFWQTTGSNDIIGEIIGVADAEIYERLTSLVNGKSFVTYIDTSVIYPQIKSNPSSIYSFLLVAGYLKVLKTVPAFSGDFMCEVALPNKEIAYVYNKALKSRRIN